MSDGSLWESLFAMIKEIPAEIISDRVAGEADIF